MTLSVWRSKEEEVGESKVELRKSRRSGVFINNETRVATNATLGSVSGGAHGFGEKW